jgi:HSP20 family protein
MTPRAWSDRDYSPPAQPEAVPDRKALGSPERGRALASEADQPTMSRLTGPKSVLPSGQSELTRKKEKVMAMLTRWYPFHELARVRDEMSRAFGEEQLLFRGGESVGWTPACDIYEDGEEIVVHAELAGVEPKDVEIRFENGVLTLKGERELQKEDKRENYHRLEMSYGTFTRTFSLPATIDSEKIRAESKQGLLLIHLAKKPEAKPKSIQVKVS